MTLEQKLTAYLANVSRGVVKLTPQAAAHIIDLVLNPGTCRVIFRRYNPLRSEYEALRTYEVTEERLQHILNVSLISKPIEQCYRYDLYNEINELQGYIYSMNPNLI